MRIWDCLRKISYALIVKGLLSSIHSLLTAGILVKAVSQEKLKLANSGVANTNKEERLITLLHYLYQRLQALGWSLGRGWFFEPIYYLILHKIQPTEFLRALGSKNDTG